MRVAISPDENPNDPGSVGADGTTERSVNLKVAAALQRALQRCGVDVWFDPSLTYVERVARANHDGTTLLVACAHNESTPGKSGTEFVFCPGGLSFGQQAELADAVYHELVTSIAGWPSRRPNVEEDVWECCGFEGDTVYTEYLFMSPDDAHLWGDPAYPEAAAEATCRALARVKGFAYVPVTPPPTPLPPTPPQEATPTMIRTICNERHTQYLLCGGVYAHLVSEEQVEALLSAVPDLPTWYVSADQHDELLRRTGQ